MLTVAGRARDNIRRQQPFTPTDNLESLQSACLSVGGTWRKPGQGENMQPPHRRTPAEEQDGAVSWGSSRCPHSVLSSSSSWRQSYRDMAVLITPTTAAVIDFRQNNSLRLIGVTLVLFMLFFSYLLFTLWRPLSICSWRASCHTDLSDSLLLPREALSTATQRNTHKRSPQFPELFKMVLTTHSNSLLLP